MFTKMLPIPFTIRNFKQGPLLYTAPPLTEVDHFKTMFNQKHRKISSHPFIPGSRSTLLSTFIMVFTFSSLLLLSLFRFLVYKHMKTMRMVSSMTNVMILISTLSIFHSFRAISHPALPMVFMFRS